MSNTKSNPSKSTTWKFNANCPAGALAPDASESALQEAMRLAAFHHPNIVTVYDFVCEEGDAYVVMEFIEGETVEQMLTRGVFPPDEFLHLAQQSLEGLIAAHHIGLIHRDLKPANLMLTTLPSGAFQVKILDLGLAKFITKPSAQTVALDGTVMGSVMTMAPEQFMKLEIDARTDMYSLGCVFYAALTGSTPFTSETAAGVIAAHLQGHATPIHTLRPDVPEAVCDWVSRLFALRPEDRFASCADALVALREIISGKITPDSSKPGEYKKASRRFGPAVAFPALAAAVIVVSAGVWMSTKGLESRVAPQLVQVGVAVASLPPGVIEPHDVDKLRQRVGQQVTIEGRTVAATKDKALNVRRLSFDLDAARALTLVFPLDSGGHFSKEALAPYAGKRVRTSGVVVEDHGALQIVVKSLGQLLLVGD